ncbi:hypothetical protein HID58_024380 [Brassica napus]|uniref:Peptidase A1 domain-containing protein n=1 Tax=Brassica napus TaxID=3708 RepID=A0ABQ8D4T1_BRANA|nr:hypothetical protein HID58_024380 [Brassica napus]
MDRASLLFLLLLIIFDLTAADKIPDLAAESGMIFPLSYSSLPPRVEDLRRHRRILHQSQQLPNAHMKLYDDLLANGYYTTRLLIGTPPQEFALIVDTGSTVTYVPCSTCKHCGKHQVSSLLSIMISDESEYFLFPLSMCLREYDVVLP